MIFSLNFNERANILLDCTYISKTFFSEILLALSQRASSSVKFSLKSDFLSKIRFFLEYSICFFVSRGWHLCMLLCQSGNEKFMAC